ncbi:MAG: hypothetical protein JO256_09175 [Alphaproteobacteria bacterium]|nr:hypothetical protein [Alphaproteobacteria bacterium]
MNRRRRHHPFDALALAMRSAAANIEITRFREIGARAAASIPVLLCERGTGRRAEMARLGRKLLAGLPALAPQDFAEAQKLLRAYADALASRFEETSVERLGTRRRYRSEAWAG